MSDENQMIRRLIRQEWKPLAGYRIVRYVAMSGAYSIPGKEWTDDLSGTTETEVVNEVIGLAEVPANKRITVEDNFEDFYERIDELAFSVHWEDGWPPDDSEDAESTTETIEEDQDPEPSEEAESAESDADGQRAAESEDEDDEDDTESDGPANGDKEQSNMHASPGSPSVEATPAAGEFPVRSDQVLTVNEDGDPIVVDYDPDDEPYLLPESAGPDAVQPGVRYVSVVHQIKGYGLFVSIMNTNQHEVDVSGLIHKTNLGLGQAPEDFAPGNQIIVELDDREGGLSFLPVRTDNESVDDDLLYPSMEDQING
jgi:hypothetical protein